MVESLINKARRLIRSLGEIKIDKEYVIPGRVFKGLLDTGSSPV
jgi:hypothetical protein